MRATSRCLSVLAMILGFAVLLHLAGGYAATSQSLSASSVLVNQTSSTPPPATATFNPNPAPTVTPTSAPPTPTPTQTPTPTDTATSTPTATPVAPQPPATATPVPATTIVFDLADGDRTRPVESGVAYQIAFEHWLPAASYSVSVARHVIVEPPLEWPDGLKQEAAKKATPTPIPQLSRLCRNALGEIVNATSETELRSKITSWPHLVEAECAERIRLYAQSTQKRLAGSVSVRDGERLVLEVSRPQVGGPSKRSWRYVLTTGPAKRWLVHFGAGFVPEEDERWFAKVDDDGAGFLITEEEDRSGFQFEPVVLFTYRPAERRHPAIPFFSAGLGMDLTEVLVVSGASWVVGDNISIFAGAAGHEQARLKGKYERNQQVLENLSPDDLVEDSFQFNVIVGVGFRFSTNPFAKATTITLAPTPAPTPTPTPTPTNGSGDRPVGPDRTEKPAHTPTPTPTMPPALDGHPGSGGS